MRENRVVIFLWAVIFQFSVTQSYAQHPSIDYEKSVWKITVNGSNSNQFSQTGFVTNIKSESKTVTGLVTALHGVIKSERSIFISTQKNYEQLQITHVDVKNDIAFLVPLDGEWSIDVIPLKIDKKTVYVKSDLVQISGFPIGINTIRTRMIRVGNPKNQKLEDFGILSLSDWGPQRDSPSLQSEIINLDGVMLPGDSGAPILKSGLVFGVLNGGFHDGKSGLGWAIPVSNIELSARNENVSAINRIKILPKLSSVYYFKTTSDPYEDQVIGGVPCEFDQPSCWKSWITQAEGAIDSSSTVSACNTPNFFELNESEISSRAALLVSKYKNLIDQGVFEKRMMPSGKQLEQLYKSPAALMSQCAVFSRSYFDRKGKCRAALALLDNVTNGYCSRNGINVAFECNIEMKKQWKRLNRSFRSCDSTLFETNWVDQFL